MSQGKSLFGDYHEMADIWARIQAFDQLFMIPTVQTCGYYYAKYYPCWLLQSLSLEVCLHTFISCYASINSKREHPPPPGKHPENLLEVVKSTAPGAKKHLPRGVI